MGDDKKTIFGSKLIKLIIFLVILIACFVLLYRTPGNAQELSKDAVEKIESSLWNLRSIGLNVEAKVLGSAKEFANYITLISSLNQPVLFFDGKNLHIARLKDFYYSGESILFAYSESLNDEDGRLAEVLNKDPYLVEYYFQNYSAYVLMAADGSQSVGIFSDLSRIKIDEISEDLLPGVVKELEQRCVEKVLTKNIWDNPAEWVRICTEAQCTVDRVDSCEIYEKASQAFVFGSVEFMPANVPESGKKFNNSCIGRAAYEWSVLLGEIKILGYEVAIGGFGLDGTGLVESTVYCGRSK